MAAKWEPREYQYASTKFLGEHACAGLLHAPGLGKTSATLAAFAHLPEEGASRARRSCSRRCASRSSSGPRKIRKWKDFSPLKAQWLHGRAKERIDTDADIYLLNFDGCSGSST